jgi:hypothetical protein
MTCDPGTLLNATAAFQMLSEKQLLAINSYLLCQILNSGGGGGGTNQLYTGSYADPNVFGLMPADTTKAAQYQQDVSITPYNVWVWSVIRQKWIQTVAP